jgi:hypothetical protein
VRWCELTALPRGWVMPVQQCFELGRLWYQGRLDIDWQPKTKELMTSIFARVGLTDEFWRI